MPALDTKPRATRRLLAVATGAPDEMRLASCARDFTSSFQKAFRRWYYRPSLADEQLRRDLSVGVAFRGEARDLRLLRRELAGGIDSALPGILAVASNSILARSAKASIPKSENRSCAKRSSSGRPHVAAHAATIRHTGGGHAQDLLRCASDRAGRSPRGTGVPPPAPRRGALPSVMRSPRPSRCRLPERSTRAADGRPRPPWCSRPDRGLDHLGHDPHRRVEVVGGDA